MKDWVLLIALAVVVCCGLAYGISFAGQMSHSLQETPVPVVILPSPTAAVELFNVCEGSKQFDGKMPQECKWLVRYPTTQPAAVHQTSFPQAEKPSPRFHFRTNWLDLVALLVFLVVCAFFLLAL